ncbi:NAD-binding protein [Haladaptatus sp. CMAA 1911]|uniref:NAD-binding protein n=1 Tax=unclassified Haladaptatus TaxID=2622732 RepID=UPI003754448C
MSTQNYTGATTGPPIRGRKACIVSEGHVGHSVATRLSAIGVPVTLVDPSPPVDPPPGLQVHEVASLDANALIDANINEETTVLAVGPEDSMNLFLAQLVRTRFDVDRIIARVNDPRRTIAFTDLGIEVVDGPATISQTIIDRW